MAKYNSRFYYNKKPGKGGARYNSAPYVYELFLRDNVFAYDDVYFAGADFSVGDSAKLTDSHQLCSEYILRGQFALKETDLRYNALFNVMEKFDMLDSFSNFFVNVKTKDEFYTVDEKLQQLNNIFAEEKIDMQEIPDLNALISALDTVEFKEVHDFLASFLVSDVANFTDADPSTAISDFYISKSENGVYDILMPFGLIVDYSRTDIDFMPENVDTSVQIAGMDGEIVQDSTYRPRLFDIFAVTMDGLSVAEKENVKRKIAKILHSIKKETKTITFGESETTFDVKYSGKANALSRPGWVDFELPLKSPSSYGKKEFSRSLTGSGMIENTGDVEVGVLITIKGPCSNPRFTLGDRDFLWAGTVGQYERLVVDTNGLLCYKIDQNGKKKNAKLNLSGDIDKKVPVGSLALTVPKELENQVKTTWQELVVY